MSPEGLTGRYQTQEPALKSLRPSAATTERHIQPQGHSYSPTARYRPQPSPVSQAQSHPSPKLACTTHPGHVHRTEPASAHSASEEPGLLTPYLPWQVPSRPPPVPRHNHAEHQISRARPGPQALCVHPSRDQSLTPKCWPACVNCEVLSVLLAPPPIPPTPTSPKYATHFAAMAAGYWKPYCCWAEGVVEAAAAAVAMGVAAQ